MYALPPRIDPSVPQVTGVSCPDCGGVLMVRTQGRDAALVFEFGLGEVLDVLVLVLAPAALREERLRQSRGMDAARFRRIAETQIPDEEKSAVCDYVIVNDGSIERLRDEADAVLAAIRESMDENTGWEDDDE